MESAELVQRLKACLGEGGAGAASQLIVEEVWLAVVEGSLEPGERLPTARQLAIALGVTPRSIDRAYDQLERRGVLVTRQGAGTFVSLAPVSEEDRARQQQFTALCGEVVERAAELGYGVDDLIDAIVEYRASERKPPSEEPG